MFVFTSGEKSTICQYVTFGFFSFDPLKVYIFHQQYRYILAKLANHQYILYKTHVELTNQ
jgi:hypothetical protein